MKHQLLALDDLLVMKLSGDVTRDGWDNSFTAAKRSFQKGAYRRLLVDGSKLAGFDITHTECQRLARGFGEFARKGAFFSNDPLIFGMMRVIHSYSNNEAFSVCKTQDQAMEFLRGRVADYAV